MMILSFFINSLLAERLSKPINGAASKSINPECQEEYAAVACEDYCFFEQYSCLSSCSSDDRDCITNCNRDYMKVRISQKFYFLKYKNWRQIIFSALIIVRAILNVT